MSVETGNSKKVGGQGDIVSYKTDNVTTTNRSKRKVQEENIKSAENKDTVSISKAGREKAVKKTKA